MTALGIIWTWLTGSKVGRLTGLIAAGLLALAGIRWDAKRDGRREAEVDALADDMETIKRVQNETGEIRTADDARGVLERRRDR